MNIVVVSDNYPSDRMPNKGAFVYNLVQELSHYHSVTVVAPFKIHELFRKKLKGGYGREHCKAYRPLYLSLGNNTIMGVELGSLSFRFQSKAVDRCLSRLREKPDLIYSHFIQNALTAVDYSIRNKVPLAFASGESNYKNYHEKPEGFLKKLIAHTRLIICVSEMNKKGLTALGFDTGKMSIVPNAADHSLFKPMDKDICKEKSGILKNKFVVGFVGHFIHRKGPNRIIEAIKSLNDPDIQLICVGGKGNLMPSDFTTEIAPVPNYRLPEIYNTFDIFVLPTLNEGHCNAIEEAKACCIPVVSSLGTSVETQIDSSTGILIDPMNIAGIASAIKQLKDNPDIRQSMTENLKAERGDQSLKNRAQKISTLLESVTKI